MNDRYGQSFDDAAAFAAWDLDRGRDALASRVPIRFQDTPAPQSQESATELARKAQNPIANLISVPFQNNTNFGVGPNDNTANQLLIQPVVPTPLSDDWLLINRAIFPVVYSPPPMTGDGGEFGLGNIQYQGFFTPVTDDAVTWGVGPLVQFPSATDDRLGVDSWSLGPAFIVLTMPQPWVLGVTANHIWSLGADGSDKVSLTFIQPFINYNFGEGWYAVTAPAITANDEAPGGDVWTVPVGGGIGKLFKVGEQPINTTLQYYYNAAQPDNGADWTLRIQIQFLF